MLDPKFKAQWIAALRSGEYKQGRGTLKTRGDHYCCIGVARKLLDDLPKCNLNTANPGKAAIALGLEHVACIRLAEMNDGSAEFLVAPHSFAEIADFIDAHL